MDTMFVNSKQQQKQTERACEKRAIGMSIMNTWVTMTNSVKYGWIVFCDDILYLPAAYS